MTVLTFRILRAFRWVLPVFYIGLGIGLVIYASAYVMKLASFATYALKSDPLQNALALLNLIDSSLLAGLTLLVMTSCFAIFVGKPSKEEEAASGPATVGFAALKTKFAATLTAIGAVNLLEYTLDYQNIQVTTIAVLGAVECVFLAVTLAFAFIERMSADHDH